MDEVRWNKLQNVASRLNKEAGRNKANWSGTKKRPIFTPCARATILIEACSDDRPLPEVTIEAYNEPCICHGNFLSISHFDFHLWTLDDSYR